MELGGKAAAIVCADADLERAARGVVFGGFANSGQVCISVERVYAHESLYERFIQRVTELTRELRQGDPDAYGTDVGAIIFPKQIEIAERLIEDALGKGAQLAAGGHRREGKGQFFEPTILTGCTQDMAVMREEIFGPVVPIMKVRDEDEAIRLANDSHLGLMGYVFTRDRDKGRRIAERVRAGTVMVNDVLIAYAAPETPFGGVKESGYGRVHGEEGLRDMCELRHVNYDRVTLGSREPLWYPYGEKTYKATLKGLRLLFRRGSPVQKILDLF
jgi:succinate-semialdehyde dehydrogenase/glutarate-semialdehyde dehydrogenase